jgi:hypothetical protein
MFAIREIKDEEIMYTYDERGKIGLGEKIPRLNEEEEDDAWTPGDDDEEEQEQDEPLEYCSDDGAHTHDEDADVEMREASGDISDAEGNGEILTKDEIRQFWLQGLVKNQNALSRLAMENDNYPAWYNGIPRHINLKEDHHIVDDMHALFYPGRDDASEHGTDASFASDSEDLDRKPSDKLDHWLMGKLGYHRKDEDLVEHIAGPGCKNLEGYSGHEISAEEMRGCQTLQCLVQKTAAPGFDPLPDDEDFERTSRFFLSGLSGHMPSRDYGVPRFKQERHGCEMVSADNCIWQEDDVESYAMPFHPSCFEVFKRVSLSQSGKIDVVGLTSWWCLEANYDQFNGFPRDPNVHSCHEQEWKHRRGTAYLVANPLYVPSFRRILEAATETDCNFNPRNGAFSIPDIPMHEFSMNTDPFNLLPVELRMEVLHNLSSKDIASLRLSSRTFRQLPVSYFQSLLLREMPWVWEAWPTTANPNPLRQIPYSIWATLTTAEVEPAIQSPEHDLAVLTDYVDIVKSEMPELAQQLDEAFLAQFEAIQESNSLEAESLMNDRKPFYLQPDKTNYFILYTLITRHWNELRGLQNRKRIWKDCEEILKRIAQYREDGHIGDDGITEDLRDVVTKQNEDSRRRREERERRRRI